MMLCIKPGFDSMDIRHGYWSKTWLIPGTNYHICGYSRAAYRTGFYIKELDLMLDAGPQNFNRPGHIMLTHIHDDHIAELPLTLIPAEGTEKVPIVYAPVSSQQQLAVISRGFPYKFCGLETGLVYNLVSKGVELDVDVFKCDHSIDTISYGFSVVKHKLKPEYMGMGSEIRRLKESGITTTQRTVNKQFAFICDTSINIFITHPEILEYPVIFIECTFLDPADLEHANKNKHIHWLQLEPYVRDNSNVQFMLFHFSLKLGSDQSIRDFFSKIPYNNVSCWA